MSAPLKPWEQQINGMVQSRTLNSSAPINQFLNTPVGRYRPTTLNQQTPVQLPPRLPANNTSNFSNYYSGSNYPGSYNSYSGLGNYGSYGSYGGMYGSMYNNYGGMYGNRFGYGPGFGYVGPESRFIQLAEESTRPAFQGIESIVRAFSSVSMMLDSTFFAITNSFRAVLGVAENFGQIRSMFGQLWNSFALFRFITWIYRKLLQMLGFKVANDVGTVAWNEAIHQNDLPSNDVKKTSSWPIFMFLGAIISAPYLISKILPPIVDLKDPKNWSELEPTLKAKALYHFQATNNNELSMLPGDDIIIAPKSVQDKLQLTQTGWVQATSKRGVGVVPFNHLDVYVQATKNINSNISENLATQQQNNLSSSLDVPEQKEKTNVSNLEESTNSLSTNILVDDNRD